MGIGRGSGVGGGESGRLRGGVGWEGERVG